MKRIFLNLLLLLSACWLQAQTQLTVSGTVTKITTGAPVADWSVMVFAGDPADSTVWLFNVGFTDANGQYSIAVDVPPGIDEVTVSTFNDCNNAPAQLEQQVPVSAGQATVDFQVCADQPPVSNCWTWINVVPTGDSLTFSFSAEYYGFDSTSSAAGYLWEFGDGTSSTEANPTHTYAAAGFYIAQVTVTGTDGCVASAEFPFSTDFPPFPECFAYINYIQTATTSFDFSTLAFGPNGDPTTGDSTAILSYFWDFGDSTSSTEATPSHTYSEEGIYTVQLTIVTEDSCEAYACAVVFAFDCPVDTFWYGCQAMFVTGPGGFDPNGNPTGGGDPLTVTFYDVSLGAVQTWNWDFGDGGASTEQNPTHTYAEEGFYTVTLSITTIDGCQSSATFDVYAGDDFPWIPEPDCQALFIPLPDSIGGTGIQFIDVSFSPTPIQSWSWNFGDGTAGNEQNPYHVYAQPGVYTVSLEIEADSCNSMISFEIDTDNPWRFTDVPAQLGVAGSSTGVEEQPVFEKVKLFPNPVATELNVAFVAAKAGDCELRISDLTGKMLTRLQHRAEAGENTARINVARLTPGFYLAELRSADRVQTFKFVKE